MVKTPESMAIEVVRLLMLASQSERVSQLLVTVATEVANYINNRKRRELTQLEDQGKMVVQVVGAKGVSPEHLLIECSDSEGRTVRFPET